MPSSGHHPSCLSDFAPWARDLQGRHRTAMAGGEMRHSPPCRTPPSTVASLREHRPGTRGEKMMRLCVIAFAVATCLASSGTVAAAPGDSLASITPVAGCTGVGVAYDGTNILFTCAGDAVVHKTDFTGADNGGVTILGAGGVTPGLDAIAYDPTESALYGGDVDGSGTCRIWSADLTTGIATPKFSYGDPGPLARCSVSFYDGITVDTVTNTIYTSPDVNDTIHHFTKAGAPAGPDIAFTALTAGQCPWAQSLGATGCWNSGLAIGLDGNLFAGTANDGLIKQLDRSEEHTSELQSRPHLVCRLL